MKHNELVKVIMQSVLETGNFLLHTSIFFCLLFFMGDKPPNPPAWNLSAM